MELKDVCHNYSAFSSKRLLPNLGSVFIIWTFVLIVLRFFPMISYLNNFAFLSKRHLSKFWTLVQIMFRGYEEEFNFVLIILRFYPNDFV